jgi:hypothetical protein
LVIAVTSRPGEVRNGNGEYGRPDALSRFMQDISCERSGA